MFQGQTQSPSTRAEKFLCLTLDSPQPPCSPGSPLLSAHPSPPVVILR